MSDLLEHVLASVVERPPVDARERISIDAFVTAVVRLERPFDEHADPVHITGSALVVGERGILLHRHKRLGIWLQPGGHIDPGETPWEAARRETAEETGLPAELTGDNAPPVLAHVDVHPGGRHHTHLDLRYFVTVGDADPAPPPGESQDVRWFTWDEALAVADPGLAGILAALAGDRQP